MQFICGGKTQNQIVLMREACSFSVFVLAHSILLLLIGCIFITGLLSRMSMCLCVCIYIYLYKFAWDMLDTSGLRVVPLLVGPKLK